MKEKSKQEEMQKKLEEDRKKALIAEIHADFDQRREARRSIETSWELNMNFVSGNQYCDISPSGDLVQEDKDFYWQSRRCFNHVAPTIDTRLARLAKVRPTLEVRAFSDSEGDIKTARLCSGILRSVKNKLDLDKIISAACLWSETCGSAFYKILWNFEDGNIIGTDDTGHSIREGDVNVVAVSPFEIYPDSLTAEGLDGVKSLIHAKAMPVSEIKERYGAEIVGHAITEFPLIPFSQAGGWKKPTDGAAKPVLDSAEIVIERYTRPTEAFPEGRLEIVAGDTLLYEGPLPYRNKDRGERTFPFAMQTCIPLAGSFFGTCVVDRMIPLQRAYNAVRNRKHEFLNRLSMGVIAVEDGSVDADELSEEGLYPGKVLVYRQGSSAPTFLECGSMPSEFHEEEERISDEFILVSGMSEISRNSANPTHVTSGVGLQILLDQDQNRMQSSIESVERAVKEVGKQTLHLYKQFASAQRVLSMTGTGGHTELFWFSASDISADDVEFGTGYERTAEETRQEILELLRLGLLNNEEGALSGDTRNRVLEALGYGSLESARDISSLHLKKAERENLILAQRDVEADVYDDHELHIAEHMRYLLSGGEENQAVKERVLRHISSHRKGA